MQGHTAGLDGLLCTADDVPVALTAAQALNALNETVGHECAHGCHVEHKWCEGDQQVIPVGQGKPNRTGVDAGPDGICNTAAAGDDVQVIPVAQGQPGATIITDGGDGLQTTPAGDDAIQGTFVTSGADGIAQTTAAGNDVQIIAVGRGAPNAHCIDTGANGISNSAAIPDDVQRIPVGNGEPFQICVGDAGDGQLLTRPSGDDTLVGLTVTTGTDGVCDSFAVARITGGPSVMTSDVLVPVPSTYNADDSDEVRFHLKHP